MSEENQNEGAIFLATCVLGPDELDAYLATACDGKPGLKKRIMQRLVEEEMTLAETQDEWTHVDRC